ncbi:MAG: NosD domain-containing protein [Candidatus Bathyarchaeota archaeon]
MNKINPLFSVFLISFFVLASFPQLIVKAQDSTIYIRADGTIEGTDKIQRIGDIYTLIDDINGSIVVERNNIVLDGSGFILQGTSNQPGGDWDFVNVNISSRKNVTIKDMAIKYAGHDTMQVFDSYNCSILNTTILITQGNYPTRIHLTNSSNNFISGNYGQIYLEESDTNILVDNPASVILSKSLNNLIIGNRDIELNESSNNTISRNNSSISLKSMSNGNTISENTGFIGLWQCSNNSITGNNGDILVFESNNNTVAQNNVTNHEPFGIQLAYSSGNLFSQNIIQNCKLDIRFVVNSTFYHNNFLNVSVEIIENTALFWDNGSQGNYWSNYNGIDSNGDGIGDTPYIINEENQDNYPLMEQIVIPEFPSWLILPLFLVLAPIVVVIRNKVTKNEVK